MSSDGDNPFESIGDALTQVWSKGLGGLTKKGGLKLGAVGEAVRRGVDEGLGEVTGRNLARRQKGDAEAAIREEEMARQQELQNQREQQRQDALAASLNARGLRRRGVFSSRSTTTDTTDESNGSDFLGL